MSGKARIGVIGAGWWAVVNHIPVLQANTDCEVVAVNRLGADDLAAVQTQFGIGQGFEDYREMLDTVEMDGVVISSPHVLHFEHASAALAKGCHVLVEKPLTTNAADARALVAAAEGGARDRRPLWLELQADGGRGGAAGRRGRQGRACRAANGQRPRRPLRRPADAGDRRGDVPAAAIDLGRSETRRRLRLGTTGPRARAPVPGRRPRTRPKSSR